MARIQSAISSAFDAATQRRNEATETTTSANRTDTAASESTGACQGSASSTLTDRWESARSRGGELFEGLTNRARVGSEAVREAVVGRGGGDATVGLERMAQFMGPGPGMVDTIREVRTNIEQGVREQLAGVDTQILERAAEFAFSEAGDLRDRIEEHIGEAGQVIRQAGDALVEFNEEHERRVEEQQAQTDQLRVAFGAEVGDRVNTLLNNVSRSCAEAIVAHREEVIAIGQGLQGLSDRLEDFRLRGGPEEGPLQTIFDLSFPVERSVNLGTRWALNALGSQVERSVDVAEYLLETPGLPTQENFDEWIEQIEPGERLRLEGSFLVSGAKTLGARGGAGQALILERCATDPNQVSLTVERDMQGAVLLGAEAQEQGGAVALGGRTDTAIQMAFDLSRPEDRAFMADYVLANQMGLPSETTLRRAEEYITSYAVGGDAFLSANLGGDFFGANRSASAGAVMQFERRTDGPVHRVAIRTENQGSIGSNLGRVPSGFIDDLAASAPTAQQEMAGRLFAGLAAGQVGAQAGISGEVVVGAELEDGRIERLFLEMELDGSIMGHSGQVKVEFNINDPLGLARELGMSVADLSREIAAGNLSMDAIYEAANRAGTALDEGLGLRVTTTTNHVEGMSLDVFGIKLGSTVERRDQQILLNLGTPIDRTLAGRHDDEPAPDLRVLDRAWPG